MALRVYNTLTRKTEDFKPLTDGEVRVYICGLTVYDDMHIGHARTYVAFDSILRYLRYRGYRVRYIQNVTDVDDKIIKRAKERNTRPLELSKEYARRAYEDQRSLGLLEADAYPKVTENIGGIIAATEALIRKGIAYVTEKGVYFDVSKAEGYGLLSNQDTKQLGQHRVEPDPDKRTPLDFSLWKRTGEGELGFESPWGVGRPGWHIECTVMSQRHLGDQIDIHGGALDLIFPHHENEIAQSEALTGKRPFVRYWMHTGFLNSSGEKMSKSLGNILAVREFLKTYSADAFRLFILQTHYRSPVDYSTQNVENAKKAAQRLADFKTRISFAIRSAKGSGSAAKDDVQRLRGVFDAHMDDDFNTPQAVGALFDSVRHVNAVLDAGGDSPESLTAAEAVFDDLFGVMGLRLGSGIDLTDDDKGLIKERDLQRAAKNWVESDRLRDELLKRGLKIKDQKDGSSTVERV
ncbi:MAG: cysteine--tRNA ligase [Candidatus Altiarchaeota archaeon]